MATLLELLKTRKDLSGDKRADAQKIKDANQKKWDELKLDTQDVWDKHNSEYKQKFDIIQRQIDVVTNKGIGKKIRMSIRG